MGLRTRNQLLSWGKFSTRFLARARFGEKRSWSEVLAGAARLVALGVAPPVLASVVYLLPLPGPDAGGVLPLASCASGLRWEWPQALFCTWQL